MNSTYHDTRLAQDDRRTVLWRALWQYYFSKLIAANDCVLDLGCGYGDFINTVVARRRIALDTWPGFREHIHPDVESIVANVTDLSQIQDNAVDFIFASNLFEHISQTDFSAALAQIRRKLTPEGTLNILQPNYRYAYREYFDDYTHIAIYSHVSLEDFLKANQFDVIASQPRFLPLTIKSRFPVSPLLIRGYLLSPVKFLAKQMLIRARPTQRKD